jgi:poly(A) polymerase
LPAALSVISSWESVRRISMSLYPLQRRSWARELAVAIAGTCIVLGREEGAARVVRGEWIIDISSFREGACTIADELTRRDLTVNALAVRIDPLLTGGPAAELTMPILDPTGGLADLADKRIRAAAADSFVADPLRLLRVFRFAATLNFTIDSRPWRWWGGSGGCSALQLRNGWPMS